VYKHILIATDGSKLATKALEHGLDLAKRDNAQVTVVTVTEPWSPLEMAKEARENRWSDPISQFEALASAAAKRILDAAIERGNAYGLACDRIHVKDQPPAEGIIAAAKDKGCDLIVMASHGRRGAARLLLGSQAYEVLTTCSVPVLIVR
jgi:nucleotide-binding universal stress UspA family protein